MSSFPFDEDFFLLSFVPTYSGGVLMSSITFDEDEDLSFVPTGSEEVPMTSITFDEDLKKIFVVCPNRF